MDHYDVLMGALLNSLLKEGRKEGRKEDASSTAEFDCVHFPSNYFDGFDWLIDWLYIQRGVW